MPDPETMTARERVTAIAELLALGYLRSLATRSNCEKTLGESGEPRPVVRAADRPATKETA